MFKKMFKNLFDNFLLLRENTNLKHEITRLQIQRKDLLTENDTTRCKTEKDFDELLSRRLREKDNHYNGKIKKLKQKIQMLNEDRQLEKKDLREKFKKVDEQATKIIQFSIDGKTHVERLEILRGEELNSAGALIENAESFQRQYEPFRKEFLEYFEDIDEEV